MKNYIKVSSLSLVVLAGISMEIRGENKFDIYSADGSITRTNSTNQEHKELPALVDYAISGAKVASIPVEKIARYAAAYNSSYYCIEGLKEATALGLYGAAYLAGTYTAGPVLGLQAANFTYYGTKSIFTAMNYLIPGYNGVLAAAYTPAVKLVTDKLIDYTPAALGVAYAGASSLVSGGASLVSSIGSAFSSWYSPTEPTPNFNFSGSSIERMFSSSIL
jgi:hypothetical protein